MVVKNLVMIGIIYARLLGRHLYTNNDIFVARHPGTLENESEINQSIL